MWCGPFFSRWILSARLPLLVTQEYRRLKLKRARSEPDTPEAVARLAAVIVDGLLWRTEPRLHGHAVYGSEPLAADAAGHDLGVGIDRKLHAVFGFGSGRIEVPAGTEIPGHDWQGPRRWIQLRPLANQFGGLREISARLGIPDADWCRPDRDVGEEEALSALDVALDTHLPRLIELLVRVTRGVPLETPRMMEHGWVQWWHDAEFGACPQGRGRADQLILEALDGWESRPTRMALFLAGRGLLTDRFYRDVVKQHQ